MESRMGHVCFNVPDVEAARDWYVEHFEFQESSRWSSETNQGHTTNLYIADEQGFEIQFREAEDQTSYEMGTAWGHIALEVDNVQEIFSNLNGHEVIMAPEVNPDTGDTLAFINDPFGFTIELLERS